MVEVACSGSIDVVLGRLLHDDDDGSHVVHCHVHDFFVLCCIEELAVLVNDEPVSLVNLLSRHRQAVTFRLFLTVLAPKSMLHEAGEHLCELDLSTFLSDI